jgi:hypothetical protein
MSYKTRWYDRHECAQIAREISTPKARVFGIELEDHGGNDIRMNGGYGANIEAKLLGLGYDRTAILDVFGVDGNGNWIED